MCLFLELKKQCPIKINISRYDFFPGPNYNLYCHQTLSTIWTILPGCCHKRPMTRPNIYIHEYAFYERKNIYCNIEVYAH